MPADSSPAPVRLRSRDAAPLRRPAAFAAFARGAPARALPALALALAALPLHARTPSAPEAASAPAAAASGTEERRNWFDDPFVQATHGLPGCPEPEPPLLTRAEMQHETHWRAERGTSCYRSGRCRLPNAYLYDAEIVPRVVKAIAAAGAYEDTSVWIEGQRRWVWLKGCVSTKQQALEMEQMVRLIDDVEAVIPQLVVGTAAKPPYRLAHDGVPGQEQPSAAGPAASTPTP